MLKLYLNVHSFPNGFANLFLLNDIGLDLAKPLLFSAPHLMTLFYLLLKRI